jgi:hypothetical protein
MARTFIWNFFVSGSTISKKKEWKLDFLRKEICPLFIYTGSYVRMYKMMLRKKGSERNKKARVIIYVFIQF